MIETLVRDELGTAEAKRERLLKIGWRDPATTAALQRLEARIDELRFQLRVADPWE